MHFIRATNIQMIERQQYKGYFESSEQKTKKVGIEDYTNL